MIVSRPTKDPDADHVPVATHREAEEGREWARFRNLGDSEPVFDLKEFQPPLLCAVGDPARICSYCKDGWHDLCKGSCEDCGERYHADGDSVYIFDKRAEQAELDDMARRGDL